MFFRVSLQLDTLKQLQTKAGNVPRDVSGFSILLSVVIMLEDAERYTRLSAVKSVSVAAPLFAAPIEAESFQGSEVTDLSPRQGRPEFPVTINASPRRPDRREKGDRKQLSKYAWMFLWMIDVM